MEMLPLELPLPLIDAAHLDVNDLSNQTARLLALELFRENKISLGRAAELCQTPLSSFMSFAAEHAISPINYGESEAKEDRQALAELGL